MNDTDQLAALFAAWRADVNAEPIPLITASDLLAEPGRTIP
ncbi:hypothetical protein [Amycolatopsis thermoflava]|nr:hypothetical protein [Amycolatopsis thermoflava]